ncbi:MaoC family dehydratase [Cnuibacter physcomitrellae]|uniref:MaoC family dehydratase n=1 Tax=Cnuibacter physcomitrellae TaxID=1619308 RepID=UPI002175A13F|nr:MaoC family dehydratase [Cnuibacter physcomitrellae]MCS5498328.1 MaoC family dehydratase [Cnuibacter physcomitrellae]
MTVVFRGIDELSASIGRTLGPSEPLTVDQGMIDRFAAATLDRQWIHNDVERAVRENGGTIAHGLLTLSLIVPLANDVYRVDRPVALNYGFDRVRFLAPVASGAGVSATFVIAAVDPSPRGTKVSLDVTIAVDGAGPACVARWLTFYPDLVSEEEPDA